MGTAFGPVALHHIRLCHHLQRVAGVPFLPSGWTVTFCSLAFRFRTTLVPARRPVGVFAVLPQLFQQFFDQRFSYGQPFLKLLILLLESLDFLLYIIHEESYITTTKNLYL